MDAIYNLAALFMIVVIMVEAQKLITRLARLIRISRYKSYMRRHYRKYYGGRML